MSARRAAGIAGAVFVAASFLSFPHPLGAQVLDLGLVASWIAPAALLLALRGLAPGAAARRGLLLGWLAYGAILHWIYVVTVRYGSAPQVVGVLAPALLALYPAAFTAGFAALAARLHRLQAALRVPALAATWTAVDWSRSFLLTGFPWATLGYGLHRDVPLLGLASATGVYGLSFTAVLAAAAAVEGLAPLRGPRRPGLALAGLAAVVALHGAGVAIAPGPPRGGTLRVGLAQGNIDQGVKWSPQWAERTLEVYEELTAEAAAQGAQLVLWPETAVPGSLEAADLYRRIAELARSHGITLVVGAVGVDWQGRDEPPLLYDSAYVVGPDGTPVDRYDKTHLVPFGEYLPLRPLLGRFIRAIATGSTARDVSAGERPRALVLPLPGGARLRAGVPICYELLFPDLVRRFAADGAQALLSITNDAWYGRSGAPFQFLAITALRSAETGLAGARAANTGVSALIDERGRVREQTEIFERGVLVGEVPLRSPDEPATFYARHGDVFAWACALAAGLGAVVARRRPQNRPQNRPGGE